MRLTVIVVCLFVLVIAAPQTGAVTLIVDQSGGGMYTQIQPAVDAASHGDTVLVLPGYYNTRVLMKNGVSLIGSGPAETIIDGTGFSYSTVECEGFFDSATLIHGFRIQGGTGPGWSASGVWLGTECFAIVSGNLIIGNTMGILSNYNHGAPQIIHNTIVANSDCGFQVYTGSGVEVHGVAKLTDNIVAENGHYGVYRGAEYEPFPPEPILDYNCVWGNGYGDFLMCSAGPNGMSADPDFCMNGAAFDIEETSICAGAASDGTDIGAFEAGCGMVVVEERSWGTIKAMFR